jgi:hypothetical protein
MEPPQCASVVLYTLKLWDDAVGNELIYAGAEDGKEEGDRFIGFYVGRPLILSMPNGVTFVPFKRCLSYQMFVSVAVTKFLTAEASRDFASDIDGWLAKSDDLMVLRRNLEMTVAKETDEELEERI